MTSDLGVDNFKEVFCNYPVAVLTQIINCCFLLLLSDEINFCLPSGLKCVKFIEQIGRATWSSNNVYFSYELQLEIYDGFEKKMPSLFDASSSLDEDHLLLSTSVFLNNSRYLFETTEVTAILTFQGLVYCGICLICDKDKNN